MASFVNEISAKTTIENIVKKYTNDFKLFVRNREPISENKVEKRVEFVLILLPSEESGYIYDELFSHISIDTVSSSLFLDEKSRQEKEAFYIKTVIEVDYDL